MPAHTILSVIDSILSLAEIVAEWSERRKYIDIGKLEAFKENIDSSREAVGIAKRIRGSVDDSGMSDDPFNRASRKDGRF